MYCSPRYSALHYTSAGCARLGNLRYSVAGYNLKHCLSHTVCHHCETTQSCESTRNEQTYLAAAAPRFILCTEGGLRLLNSSLSAPPSSTINSMVRPEHSTGCISITIAKQPGASVQWSTDYLASYCRSCAIVWEASGCTMMQRPHFTTLSPSLWSCPNSAAS